MHIYMERDGTVPTKMRKLTGRAGGRPFSKSFMNYLSFTLGNKTLRIL